MWKLVWRGLGGVVLAGVLGSCVSIVGQKFDEGDFGSANAVGSAVVRGHAFMTLADGTMRYAKDGTKVRMMPVNKYTTAIVATETQGRGYLADPRFLAHVRVAQTDGAGNFAFTDMAPGEYYVLCKVWYDTASLTNEGGETEVNSSLIVARITVQNGQTVTIANWAAGPVKTEVQRW